MSNPTPPPPGRPDMLLGNQSVMPSDIQRELTEARAVVTAADKLESWLGRNAGETSDWPLRLKLDNTESANELTRLLADLQTTLKPFRK